MEAKAFGTRLRELRIKAHLTQRELAGKIGVDFSYLSKIENGVFPPPSEKVILELTEVLNADKDELIISAGRIPADIAAMLKNQKILELLRSERTRKKVTAKKGEGVSLLTRVPRPRMPIFNYKNFARVAIAIMLVIAVGTSLWFASPQPVKALTIGITAPSSATIGSPYQITVLVTVQSADILPIQSAYLDIQSSTSPGTYKARCTNLPLTNGGTSTSISAVGTSGTSGTVSVTAATGSNWAYADPAGSRSGYGYGYGIGWGTHDLGSGFGYGYGYGGAYTGGSTTITYIVNWTPPSDWAVGIYEIKVFVVGSGSVSFTNDTTSSFTLSAAAAPTPAAPVVTVGEPPPEPCVGDVSDIVDEEGVFTSLFSLTCCEDENVNLFIPKGTKGLTQEDEPLSEITITVVTPPPPPEGFSFIGLYFDLGPSGATFDPEISLTFTYNPDWLPPGADPENLTIAYYDEDAGAWVILDAKDIVVDPDTNTITAKISHFTKFSVLARVLPATFTASDLAITPAEVDIAQSVKISVTITNSGDKAGSHKVVLKINGIAVSTKRVTLDAQATEKVTFTTAQGAAGTYIVSVDGLSGKFTVKPAPIAPVVVTAPPAPPAPAPAVPAPAPVPVPVTPEEVPPVPPFNWWLIGGIIAAVIIIGTITWFAVARRRGY